MTKRRSTLTASSNAWTSIDLWLANGAHSDREPTIDGMASYRRPVTIAAPYFLACAAAAAALGETGLAAQFGAPLPVTVSSGCMLAALLLAAPSQIWRAGLIGLAAITSLLAVDGMALHDGAFAATVVVGVATIARLLLSRLRAAELTFPTLGSVARFCAGIALAHLVFAAPLLSAFARTSMLKVSLEAVGQTVLASALGMAIVSAGIVPFVRRLGEQAEQTWSGIAEFWATMLTLGVATELSLRFMAHTPFFLILAVIVVFAFRLSTSAVALGILIAAGVGTATLLITSGAGQSATWGAPTFQMFIAIGFVTGIAIAAALAERSRLIDSLAETRDQLQTALRDTGNIIFHADLEGRYTFLSPTWEGLMQIPVASALGRTAYEFVIPSERDLARERFASFVEEGHTTARSIRRFVRGNGETLDLEITYRHREASNGRGAGIEGAMRDITEVRAVQTELERTRRELIQASRLSAMSALTSTIAHELNQPLLAVANFSRGLKRVIHAEAPDLSPFVGETLDDIDAGVLRAATIVKRMRALIEKSTIRKERHSLSEIVADSRSIGLIDAASNGLECQVDLAPEADPVLVDPVQIQQVVVNLLRNAVDAMEGIAKPQILIRSRADGDWVEVHVADRGRGISEESLTSVFKPFDSTKFNGMGVGLSISRTIVEAHGGKIWAENRFPSGACFKFTIPRAPPF